MWTTIQLQYHKETDANNRWEACNLHSYSDARKKSMTNELYDAILWKEREDVLDIILHHLDKEFWSTDMAWYEQHIIKALEKDKEEYIKKMEQLTKHQLPYDKITCYLTTLPRCPYNWEKWQIRIYYKVDNPVWILLHEMLHFQFFWRYRNHPKVKLLSKEQFGDLKESLTFLLNHEFKNFIEYPDVWYKQHKDLRKHLEEYRISQPENQRDFEKLVEYGCDMLLKNNNEI